MLYHFDTSTLILRWDWDESLGGGLGPSPSGTGLPAGQPTIRMKASAEDLVRALPPRHGEIASCGKSAGLRGPGTIARSAPSVECSIPASRPEQARPVGAPADPHPQRQSGGWPGDCRNAISVGIYIASEVPNLTPPTRSPPPHPVVPAPTPPLWSFNCSLITQCSF